MKAIVLSAGHGRRLHPLTADRPKCLVELSGRSLLEWQLRALALAGVSEALVVTGYGADKVDAVVAGLDLPNFRARTVHNPFYSLTDNLATCWTVRAEIAGGCLILNGDTLFEPEIARRLLAAPEAEVTLTIDRKDSYDSDDMKVETADGRLLHVGKTLQTYDGESIGFSRLSPAGAGAFVRAVEQALRREEGLKRWYLSVYDQLAAAGHDVRVTSIQGLQWGEMDFPADVETNQALTAAWRERGVFDA